MFTIPNVQEGLTHFVNYYNQQASCLRKLDLQLLCVLPIAAESSSEN